MRSRLTLLLLLMVCGAALAEAQRIDQPLMDALGQDLKVEYQVLSNLDNTKCQAHIPTGECFSARITLSTGSHSIPKSTALYFSHIAPVRGFTSSAAIDIEHINGDLHRIKFNEGVAQHSQVSTDISAPFWHASRSDVMPNYYLTYQGLTPVVVNSTTRVVEPGSLLLVNQHATQWQQQAQYKRSVSDTVPLMDSTFLYERASNGLPVNKDEPVTRVIPSVTERNDTGKFLSVTHLHFSPDSLALLAPARQQMPYFGLLESSAKQASGTAKVKVSISSALDNESAYSLNITHDGIQITAGASIGANYALLTIMQLWDKHNKQLPITNISDSPRFQFRGMHVDVARHFVGKEALRTLISQMFTYKLNKLHLHLSDDEGWRVQISALPELTDIGAYRCHDVTETECLMPQLGSGPHKNAVGNGYLTEQDYIELVQMAHVRGIEIIPSFDMPGHARAAIVAMNARYHRTQQGTKQADKYLLVDAEDTTEYESVQFYNDNTMNPCLDSTYTFVETVMSSVKALHERAGAPLNTFHIGADETAGAWTQSPACHAKGKQAETLLPEFVTRVQQIASTLNLQIGGWSDGIEKAVNSLDTKRVYANVWHLLAAGGSETVSHFSAANVPVVLSFPDVLYFDFPYASNPLEPGYYWGSKATDSKKVFSLLPQKPWLHSQEWRDRMGNTYTTTDTADMSSVVGIQGQLWTEVTVNKNGMEYMVFPRMLALAERAWHFADWQQNANKLLASDKFYTARNNDWAGFQAALYEQHAPALVAQGVNLRVPIPAAKRIDGMLHIKNVTGLTMEYSPNGETWKRYEQPVRTQGRVYVRARVQGTQRMSRHVLVSI